MDIPRPKTATRWPAKHSGECFAHLSRKKVLSFTVNCNSGPCYMFGTFKLVTSLPTVWFLTDTDGKISAQSPALRHPPTIQKNHFPLPAGLQLVYSISSPCDSSNNMTITYFSRVTIHHLTSTISPIAWYTTRFMSTSRTHRIEYYAGGF